MAEDEGGYVPTEHAGRARPSARAEVSPFFLMENIVEKLKLLDYENNFLSPGLCGGNMRQPAPYDDPNAIATDIIMELKALGINTDFPPAKIRSGYGEIPCSALLAIIDMSLSTHLVRLERPEYPAVEEDTGAGGDEDLEDEEMDIADEALSDHLEEEEDLGGRGGIFSGLASGSSLTGTGGGAGVFGGAGTAAGGGAAEKDGADGGGGGGGTPKHKKPDVVELVQRAEIDPEEWKLELERALPQLRMQRAFAGDASGDWRSRVDQMKKHKSKIDSIMEDVMKKLQGISGDVGKQLEKIGAREKYINSQHAGLCDDYAKLQGEYSKISEEYAQSSEQVSTYTAELAQLSDELEDIKAQMDDRGRGMTDTSPLVKIKSAITRLQQEIRQLEIKNGITQHSLLQSKLSNRQAMEQREVQTAKAKQSDLLQDEEGDDEPED